MSPLLVLIITLMSLLIIGAPVMFTVGAAAMVYFLYAPGMWDNVYIYAHSYFQGMDSFMLLAIPLFTLAGEIMKESTMIEDIVKFFQILVGRLRGGLAYVNILASMLFGGISGSGLADIAALGPIEIAMMEEDGYTKEFSAALATTSAIQGPIIPPSIPMVLFASLTHVSIGALFLAGAIPGVLIGVGQMIVVFILGKKRNFPKSEVHYNIKEILGAAKSSLLALIMPIIVLGGILGGIFTATEAGAIAITYSLFISMVIDKSIKLKDIRKILSNAAQTTASLYVILGFITVVSWIFGVEGVPGMIRNFIDSYNFSPYMLLLLLNIFFLFNGMWISNVAQLILFAPLFTPILAEVGIHPVHFGAIMVVNVMISMITPPCGVALFLMSSIIEEPLSVIVKETLPFTFVSIIVLLIVTYMPKIVLFLPNLFGFI